MAVNLTTMTDMKGNYSFSVLPGTYTISEEQQNGWLQTAPAGDVHDIVVTDSSLMHLDFGNVQLGKIAVVKDATTATARLLPRRTLRPSTRPRRRCRPVVLQPSQT